MAVVVAIVVLAVVVFAASIVVVVYVVAVSVAAAVFGTDFCFGSRFSCLCTVFSSALPLPRLLPLLLLYFVVWQLMKYSIEFNVHDRLTD